MQEDLPTANERNLPNSKIERVVNQLAALEAAARDLKEAMLEIKYVRDIEKFCNSSTDAFDDWMNSLKSEEK
ncbi:MAG: hypothetical protein QXN55_00855 [Candidatus Nitrosotenuis sp.]